MVLAQLKMLQFDAAIIGWRTIRKFLYGVTVRHSKQCAQPLPPVETHQHVVPLGPTAERTYREAERRIVEEIQRVRLAMAEAAGPMPSPSRARAGRWRGGGSVLPRSARPSATSASFRTWLLCGTGWANG